MLALEGRGETDSLPQSRDSDRSECALLGSCGSGSGFTT